VKNPKESAVGKIASAALGWAAVLYLLAWLLGWLLERKWGGFLIITGIWFVGTTMLLGGVLTVVSDDACADAPWFWCLCGAIALIVAAWQWSKCVE
jgi:hypothetical protein